MPSRSGSASSLSTATDPASALSPRSFANDSTRSASSVSSPAASSAAPASVSWSPPSTIRKTADRSASPNAPSLFLSWLSLRQSSDGSAVSRYNKPRGYSHSDRIAFRLPARLHSLLPPARLRLPHRRGSEPCRRFRRINRPGLRTQIRLPHPAPLASAHASGFALPFPGG